MKPFVNDIGTKLVIDMHTDLTGATALKFSVIKPTGIKVTWTPTIFNTSMLSYTIQAGDLDTDGVYVVQPSFSLPVNGSYSGTMVSFEVYKTL